MGDNFHSLVLAAALGAAILGNTLAFIVLLVVAAVNLAGIFWATRETDGV